MNHTLEGGGPGQVGSGTLLRVSAVLMHPCPLQTIQRQPAVGCPQNHQQIDAGPLERPCVYAPHA